MTTRTTGIFTLLAAAAATLLLISGCAATAPTSTEPSASPITIEDAWVKSADEGMSAAFGTLKNAGDADITVVSVTSQASGMIELHETVQNDAGETVMRPKDGGFVIPAGGSFELAPGGNHIMLMGLTAPLKAGDDVTFVLTLSDGSTFEFTAPVKDYSGANENYEGDAGMGSDMNMDN
jgi:periplasmic copper chaperone A